MAGSIPAGIVGASGYVGAELMRLLAHHDGFDIVFVTGDTRAGQPVADLYPHLAVAGADREFVKYHPGLLDDVAVAFLALPHGQSMSMVADLLDRGKMVVDLAADFRLGDAGQYRQWYGEPHQAPGLLERFAYGLPELFRNELVGATSVAVPGCYPTAAALALAPLVRTGLIRTEGVIVDAASGVSGAGRPPRAHTTFCAVDEDFTAYGLLDHRHTPEIQQATGASVLFTPHLAPMNRGILATCYARPSGVTSTDAPLDALAEFYATEPFIVVSEHPPSTKATLGSNAAHITARFDQRTQTVVAICAIDNLVKGAAGQAIQCANLISGLEETTGLTAVGLYP
ncbi:N-acetyl-gamma-glutamyl-phosphate reductase [Candidatus Poriferisocius sp.]|uniref:N-acetyl-gamma-glutamyl-phosphate reductase n=1 Tax=Candidatus Poriferisocius sp. TaxID=3101276 RepID=UPI003B0216EB